jgi:glycosyltransferase involved in cell wall biosynthesis
MHVSAVIPCYNYGRYLDRAIESILAQTHPVSEIIIVDDGSSDNTREVTASFGDRVRYIFQENRGRAAARNHGVRAASGDWIAFLDADDRWLPEKIELQLQVLARKPEAALIYTSAWYERRDGTRLFLAQATDPARLWPTLRYSNCVTGGASSALIRRDILVAEGGFNEQLRECEDWDCWVRLRRKHVFAAVGMPVTALTIWPGSASFNNDRMLAYTQQLMDTTLLNGLRGWRRAAWRRRIWSAALFGASINARQQARSRERALLFKSVLHWPSPLFVPKRWWALYRCLVGLSGAAPVQ